MFRARVYNGCVIRQRNNLTSNLNVHNYDTNKFTKFLINDFDWKFKDVNFSNGFNGKLMAKLKNVNYEAKNVSSYKTDQTSEIFGALGYLLDLDLKKETNNLASHFLTPKAFFRYSPDHMRKNGLPRKFPLIQVG